MSKKRFLCESACLQRACAAWIHYYTYLRNRTRILRAAPIASYQTVFYVQRRTIGTGTLMLLRELAHEREDVHFRRIFNPTDGLRQPNAMGNKRHKNRKGLPYCSTTA